MEMLGTYYAWHLDVSVYIVHDICKNLKNQKLPSSSDSLRSQSEKEKV